MAEDEGEVIGHVQFSRAWIGTQPVSALGPIGVRPDRQGQGIGSALVRAGLEEAARRGETVVIVLGDPSFYRRFGFEPGVDRGLRNPFAGLGEGDLVIAEEDFMVCELEEGVPELSGEVRWHPAFGQVG